MSLLLALQAAPAHPSSGALEAGAAAIAGTAARLALHQSSGALVAGSAAIAGAATRGSDD